MSFTEQCKSAADLIGEFAGGIVSTNEATSDALSKIIEVLTQQEERIEMLTNIIYELAPEYEIIETAADTDEERREMVNRYMNHNNDYMK